MTAAGHEMPPHVARYVDGLTEPGSVAERPDPAATTGDGTRVTVTPMFDVGYYLDQVGDHIPGRVDVPHAVPSRHAEAGHVDPAAAARWRQAQTEMVGLIREENRAIAQDPEAERVLPDSLGAWMENRVAELEQAELGEPEIG